MSIHKCQDCGTGTATDQCKFCGNWVCPTCYERNCHDRNIPKDLDPSVLSSVQWIEANYSPQLMGAVIKAASLSPQLGKTYRETFTHIAAAYLDNKKISPHEVVKLAGCLWASNFISRAPFTVSSN